MDVDRWKEDQLREISLTCNSTLNWLPQLKGWVKSGLMPSYEIHQNINPTNAPWDIVMVFEYDGFRGVALRDTIKNEVRKDLLDDPGYKKYSPIKLTFRKEDEPTTYMVILPKP